MVKPTDDPQGAADDMEWWHSLRRGALWETIGISLFAAATGVAFFFLLDWGEGSEMAITGPWPLVLLYALGGKWLIGGIFWVLGLFSLLLGVYRFLFTDTI